MDEHILPPEEITKLERIEDVQDIPIAPAYGIQETSEAFVFFAHLASAAVRWKWTAPQTFLYGLNDIIPAAIKGFEGYEKIPNELIDLSDAEIAILQQTVLSTVDFTPLNLTEEERKAITEQQMLSYKGKALGIEQTTDVARFMAKLAMFIVRNRVMTIGAIASGLMELGPAIWVAMEGIGEVIPELKDLSEDEAKVLYRAVAAEFDIADDNLEQVVEQVWWAVLMLAAAVRVLLVGLSSAMPDKAMVAKDFSTALVQVTGAVARLTESIGKLKAPPSSEPAE